MKNHCRLISSHAEDVTAKILRTCCNMVWLDVFSGNLFLILARQDAGITSPSIVGRK